MMSTRKRLSKEDSRKAALVAAREILLESGPQAVTLKAVGERVGRTHANLLHHFGSAAELQRAMAEDLGMRICKLIRETVLASRAGLASPRDTVEVLFDAYNKEGGAALASWAILTGNKEAMDPINECIYRLLKDLGHYDFVSMRKAAVALVMMALGDGLMGKALADELELDRSVLRDRAGKMLQAELELINESTGAQAS